jgi:hypothetical protein
MRVEVSAYCPNRKRRRRLTHGGGTLECKGKLQVVLTIPVILSVKSMRDPRSPERTISARWLRHGKRVDAVTVRKAFEDPTLHDIVCGLCGWSLRRSIQALSKAPRRKP